MTVPSGLFIFVCLTMIATFAAAQTAETAQPRLADQERLRRDAESPMRWIKIHAEKASGGAAASEAPAAPRRAVKPTPPKRASAGTKAASAEAGTSSPAREKPAVEADARAASSPGVTQASSPAAAPSLASVPAAPAATTRPVPAAPASTRPEPAAPLAPVETRDVAAAVPELMPIEQVEPEWDAALVKKLRKGHVNVRLVVGVDGRPTKVEVASSTDPRLGEAALVAVRRWRFVPIERARPASVDFGFDLGR